MVVYLREADEQTPVNKKLEELCNKYGYEVVDAQNVVKDNKITTEVNLFLKDDTLKFKPETIFYDTKDKEFKAVGNVDLDGTQIFFEDGVEQLKDVSDFMLELNKLDVLKLNMVEA